MLIRRFEDQDADAVSSLVRRNFIEVNSMDYGMKNMRALAIGFDADKIRQIIETLEQDECFLRAKRIEIPASITASGFYEKMGYQYKGGKKELDGEGHYRMEKFR